jgi:hypothetical protein
MSAVVYKWVRTDNGERLRNVGTLDDGTLHNPNGYPEHVVRKAVWEANERRRARRSEAARRAGETRRRRQEKRVYDVAAEIVHGRRFGPSTHCVICRKGLADGQSIERGIGSDCWQGVLAAIEAQAERLPV